MMNVSDYMRTELQVVTPGTTLAEAAYLMVMLGCSQLPVVDSQQRLIGVVTSQDVSAAAAALRENDGPEVRLRMRVAHCMTEDPVTVAPQTSIYRAVALLLAYPFGALPVVVNEMVVGMLRARDLLHPVGT